MPKTHLVKSIRLQTTIVVLLFLGSLAAVLFSFIRTARLSQNEQDVQSRLRSASQQIASAVQGEMAEYRAHETEDFGEFNVRLRATTAGVLRDFPGIEGGVYLSDGIDRFGGYAFPTGGFDAPSSATNATQATLPSPRGDDPPPREAVFVLVQVQSSLSGTSDEVQFNVRTVGPSRVGILTQPIGVDRPAHAATWTLFRLTKPEDIASQLFRYQISTGLALTGIALAVFLTLNLGRQLSRQRRDQERLREDLRRSEHLASLGKMLAGVAHEVRNPLAGIRSTVQLWQRLPETTRTPDSISAVISAVDRLNDIVTRLLFFSRADRAERVPVQVNHLLAETLELLRAQAENQGVQIAHNSDPGVPELRADPAALRQVFLNLASNALQAMPAGGRLRSATRYDLKARSIDITIQDTGNGVSDEDRKHLFEPFFTTRQAGTGLGLALCREIILQHKGRIDLTESSSAGSTFSVSLPTETAGGER